MIGERIRELRTAKSMTATELAKAADVSVGMISQVERGITDPSLETVRRIARVLDTPVFSLFQDVDAEPVAVVRRDRRMDIRSPQGGIVYQRVSSGAGKIEVLEGLLEPGAASSDTGWSHPSDECVVVLTGRLVVEVDGTRYDLKTGDSATFDSRNPHRYLNETSKPVRFLLAVTPPSY
ncbi:helix-turn-helix domain-containing protein [Actinocrispum wychmicini]|uniref:DNA-binding XRE family transcriptional regulator n=1 Tax=Actinocrispum wychmicini TaxID=1213861 RepID=A0A4R2IQ69_9PSEU|nr:XRE family transcriptional regulator [Actinocrispum wychmicini]TCO47403.1 DNA-binding XRE family transcriptional regulator [Actinocrispum wychmicini]